MKLKQDTVGRRWRFHPPQSDGKRIEIRDHHIAWFNFMYRHGGRLPTSFFHSFFGGNPKSVQRTLMRFYHGGYIARSFQQTETIAPEYNQIIHELTPKSLAYVTKHENAPSMRGAYKHQVTLSCVSASFEIQARDAYIPQHTLPNFTMNLGDGEIVRPDEVFMLDKPLLLFLEVDRGTEATESEKFDKKSWTRSIKQYRRIIGHGLYKEHFGVTCGALLLIVTVSRAKQEGILEVIRKEFPNGCNYILVTHMPEFARHFKPPKSIDVMDRYWERAGHPAVKLR